ncbi:rod shape-determining protein [Acidaminococcus sp.]|uniref:rod shape-determining protein n=1 Tax=Acidaminococcus sp. TaxID=1872103 RepID=UPI003D7C6343
MKRTEKRSLFSRLFNPVDVGIDMGTTTTRVFMKNRGILLQEPSVVAVDPNTGKVGAIGSKAREMAGKGQWEVIWPLENGVIADFDGAVGLLETILDRVVGKNLFFKPRVMLCVPTGVTGVERRAVTEAALLAGAAKTYLIEEPVAAALGAGLPIQEPKGHLVMNIGSGITSVALLSMGRIIHSASLRMGGESFNAALDRFLKDHLHLQVENSQTEEIKLDIGTVSTHGRRSNRIIRGRDTITGLPTTVRLGAQELRQGLEEPVVSLLACLHGVLEKTPPELAADLLDTGIVLTGGGSLLEGLDECIQNGTHVRTRVAPNPLECVARGAGMALDDPALLDLMERK